MRKLLFLALLFLFSCHSEEEPKTVQRSSDLPAIQSDYLPTGWYYLADGQNNFGRSYFKENGKIYHIHPQPILLAPHILSATIQPHRRRGIPSINLQLNPYGRRAFAKATESGEAELALVVDNELMTVAKVREHLTNGSIDISGYTKDELQVMKTVIDRDIASAK